MSQKILKLVQVKENCYDSEKLNEAEVGDVIGGFEVVSTDEKRCEHPKRRWSLEAQVAEEPPAMTGVCRVCGDEVVYEDCGELIYHDDEEVAEY